jgi:hypothetical protein
VTQLFLRSIATGYDLFRYKAMVVKDKVWLFIATGTYSIQYVSLCRSVLSKLNTKGAGQGPSKSSTSTTVNGQQIDCDF